MHWRASTKERHALGCATLAPSCAMWLTRGCVPVFPDCLVAGSAAAAMSAMKGTNPLARGAKPASPSPAPRKGSTIRMAAPAEEEDE